MSTAFVLSGGAGLGSIQAGMLEALFERGVEPDLIVGTSAGALNGAFIASRPPTAQTARELGDVWRGLHRGRVFPLNPLTGALGFFGARAHLVPDSGLRRIIRDHITVERLEDTAVPLHVVATDVMRGEEVRLSSGPLEDALMASAAIPGILPPVEWNGRLLIDGGVTNNAPLSHALDLGADEIYVLPTGTPCELHEPPHGALGMLLYASGILIGRRLAEETAALAPGVKLTVLPPPCPLSVQPIDFSHAGELIEQALRKARRHLDAHAPDGRRATRRRAAARPRRAREARRAPHGRPGSPRGGR